MEENSLKRKNDEMEDAKKQDIELADFLKYPKLASELRHHILTYCDGSTFSMYSQCSENCNAEIQRFNTVGPTDLKIKEEKDGVVVEMIYRKEVVHNDSVINKHVEKKFLLPDIHVFVKVQEHLLKYYKYVQNEYTHLLVMDVKIWPNGFMKMKQLENIAYLDVTIYKSMYDDFMNDLKDTNLETLDLTLNNCEEESDKVTIRADFFKSDLFRRMKIVSFHMKCEIESEDFINLQHDFVAFMESSISFDDVREKVRRWNSERHSNDFLVGVQLPDEDNRLLDISSIFPADQFDVMEHEIDDLYDDEDARWFTIGNVQVKQQNDGKLLWLTFQ